MAGTDEMVVALYAELHRIAERHAKRERCHERRDHTLGPTALINEAYIKLITQRNQNWQNDGHLKAIASTMMRRVLVDYARKRASRMPESGIQKVSLDDCLNTADEQPRAFLALDDALTRLEQVKPKHCQVVELEYFGGYRRNEIAAIVGLSPRQVYNYLTFAMAWLRAELSDQK